MRFMMMIKSDPKTEAGVLPPAELFAAMGRYNDELVRQGVLLSAEGLAPTSRGALLANRGGAISVTDGPFSEAKEVVAGYWTIQARSLAEAIEWAKRVPFEAAGPSEGPGEIEVRQVFETEDFPVGEHESGWRQEEDAQRAAPAPAVQPGKVKFMAIVRANARSEAGELPSEAELAAMGAVMEAAAREGVLIAGDGLQPTSKGARVRYQDGKRSIVDGPFSEAKELVGGFCLFQVESKAEAIAWSQRMIAAAGDGTEIELRQVFGEADIPAELLKN